MFGDHPVTGLFNMRIVRKKYPPTSEWSLLESSHENVSCQMLDIWVKCHIPPIWEW